MPFFCGLSKRASRRRQDRLSRSQVYRRLRKGLTQCARRVAAFESSDEYTTMAPWAAEAYSWDLVLQYLEDTRIATPASAPMYQTAPVLFTPEASSSRPASSSQWPPATYLDDALFNAVYRASYEGDLAYSDDETASVNSAHSSSADSASASSSAASYTTARTSLVSKPVGRRLPICPLISGPRKDSERYPGRHPDKPLVCPSEHVLAHNDFVPETEWDTYEGWDVTDDHGRAANGKFEQSRSYREVVDLLVQRAGRRPLSTQEEREASVRRVQQWLDSLMPRYTSHGTNPPVPPGVIDDEANVHDDENPFAWPSPPRPLRRTVAYPVIGRVFQDCEQWPTSTLTGGLHELAGLSTRNAGVALTHAPPYPDPEAKFRRYLLNRGALCAYLRALRTARERALAQQQQGGATPEARQGVSGSTTNLRRSATSLSAMKLRRSRFKSRKPVSFLAKMFRELEREEGRRRREARRAWMRWNESTERVGWMRRADANGGC
ncbi:hypothetical protein EV121DRAFT_215251 [Schizophyllum commune]